MHVEFKPGGKQNAFVAGIHLGRVPWIGAGGVRAAGSPGAGVFGAQGRNDLRHRRHLHFAQRHTLVVKTEGCVHFDARTIAALDEGRHIQLGLGEPKQAGGEAVEGVAVVAAQQNIGAAGPQLNVPIQQAAGSGVVVGVIARRQFQSERHPGGHVGEKPGVDALDAQIAEGVPGAGPAGVVPVFANVVGQFDLEAPLAVEHVLHPGVGEVSSDVLIIVVQAEKLGGLGRSAAPKHVLVLVIVLHVEHAARAVGEHGTGCHVKNPAPAGASPGRARRQNRGQHCNTGENVEDGLSQGVAAQIGRQHGSPGQRLQKGPVRADGTGQRQHENKFGQPEQHEGNHKAAGGQCQQAKFGSLPGFSREPCLRDKA